ncbi:MAG: valine--tRNA ligase, partial [Pseudomonadota bacterium]
MLDKTYVPADVEAGRDAAWEAAGHYRATADGEPYCIMMPPPNVTGSLHMGHALTFTVQDTLIRFQRMRGRAALWQPGTDHAGIATQMVVERELAKEGRTRQEMGREAFTERVWQWKGESGRTIVNQLRRLGASPDWSRERFTMDDGLSRAVRKAFVELYREGLIYKDKRLVNWDCQLHTAISDLEVVQKEVKGNLWYLAYPIEGTDETITVATTRPETMLGDTGVAVHPEDERYAHLVGRHAILPLVGRRIPIVADSYSDPEKGTGAVKITPAHDFNDFEVGRRQGLDAINILDADGRLNGAVPEAYRGLERFEARKRVVADLEALGVLVQVEPYTHMVPFGDRSNTVIEPFLTDQWFCDAATLAKPAIEAVETGRTRFVPKQWEATYFEWMRNIQPWCISRQLWWGHRIPAWYGPDGTVFVAETEDEAVQAARAHYGRAVDLVQDEDVLDTWFSSALWPFSTLDWPDGSPELDRFYPTDVLVTGFDIIFFWVARMMMMGLHFMGEVPFREIYIHGLVRDEDGQKMSKSKGNVVDPLELIDAYGADALRFTILASLSQGRDIKFGVSRVQGYRNFVTKLWNAARFCEMNGCAPAAGFDPRRVEATLNRWIVAETAAAAAAATEALEGYRFNDAALALYRFVWDRFCDWYLELAKPLLDAGGPAAEETRATAAWVLDRVFHLLHPMMPFVTETLNEQLLGKAPNRLIAAPWPELPDFANDAAQAEIDWLIDLVGEIRAARAELRVPAAAKLELWAKEADPLTCERLERHRPALERLARLEAIRLGTPEAEGGSLQVVVGAVTFVLPLRGAVDLAAERARLAKEIQKLEKDVRQLDAKLANPQFVAKAPADVVAEQTERRDQGLATLRRLEAARERIA